MSTPKPLTPILIQAKDTTLLTGSFLETKDLICLSQSCKQLQNVYLKNVNERKKISLLLQHVFNADPKKVKEFLSSEPKHYGKEHCLVLTRSCAMEEYFSSIRNENVPKRFWKDISPLEAAAWSGDNFLVKDLLCYVPENQREIAANQLQALLNGKEFEVSRKLELECDWITWLSLFTEYYLKPFKWLITQYEELLDEYTLCINNVTYPGKKYVGLKGIDKLWDRVWQCQENLPVYGLQEYCDTKLFHPLPTFDKEPRRSCLYQDDTPVDFHDHKNVPYGFALYKTNIPEGCGIVNHKSWPAESDVKAIRRLCAIRSQELKNMIKELKQPLLIKENQALRDEESDEGILSSKRSKISA